MPRDPFPADNLPPGTRERDIARVFGSDLYPEDLDERDELERTPVGERWKLEEPK